MAREAPPAPRPAHRPWIQLPGLLGAAECAGLLAVAEALPPAVGVIDTEAGPSARDDVRRSVVRWIDRIPATATIFDRIGDAVARINATHYRFALDGMPERLQFTEYAGDGKYDWHTDIDPARPGMEPHLHAGRRLSFSVQLSAPDDHDGGDFQIHVFGRQYTAARQLGAAIVFPAFQYHRVTAVTRGVRRSLVGWVHGPPTEDPRFRPGDPTRLSPNW